MATADSIDDDSVLRGDEFPRIEHQVTSDELTDPWCDLCFDENNEEKNATGFCPQCSTFLCKQCLDAHKRIPTMQNHTILQGERMPKTQADRPVKYLDCDIHRGNVMDHFCIHHSNMVCSQCIAEFDKTCEKKLISDLCTDIDSTDLQDLRDATETVMKNMYSIKSTMEQNKNIIKNQKNEMIKETKQLRDKLILKIEHACSSTISNINNAYDKNMLYLSNQVSALLGIITCLDQTLSKIDKIKGIGITPHVFIQLHNLVANIRHIQKEFAELEKQLCNVDLSFSDSPEISAFLSENNPLGSIKEVSSQLDLTKPSPEIAFPSPSRQTSKLTTAAGRIARDIKQIKATKMTPLNVKMADDEQTCNINGMTVTRNNMLLLADWANKKVKAVSPDNKLLSSLTLSGQPIGITVIDDTTAVASTNDEKLHILDISDPSSLVIQRSVSLGNRAFSLAPCNYYLVVTQWGEPSCVKIITITGAELLTVSTDHNGQQLFYRPRFVKTNIVNDELTVIVTDWGKETITLLDANNGDIIKVVDVKGKFPLGLTADSDGKVYICCRESEEICVWSADFCQGRILLSGRELQSDLMDIVYRDKTDEIFIAYEEADTVDRFKLS